MRWTIPVICETAGCSNQGMEFNAVRGITNADELDLVIENWSEMHEEADICPVCGKLGVAQEPVEDNGDDQEAPYPIDPRPYASRPVGQ